MNEVGQTLIFVFHVTERRPDPDSGAAWKFIFEFLKEKAKQGTPRFFPFSFSSLLSPNTFWPSQGILDPLDTRNKMNDDSLKKSVDRKDTENVFLFVPNIIGK